MDSFTTLASVLVPLPQDNIDTDIIYPARFLLITDRTGLGRFGFHDWRFDPTGAERPDFVLAQEPWKGGAILVTGINFGSGSSREQAPWALADMGIRCVIAPSFGEIFFANCFKNGILPIIVDAADHGTLMADAQAGRAAVVDLAAGDIRCDDGSVIGFATDPARRDALLNGWDEVDTVIGHHSADIDAFEAVQRREQPWLWALESETHG